MDFIKTIVAGNLYFIFIMLYKKLKFMAKAYYVKSLFRMG